MQSVTSIINTSVKIITISSWVTKFSRNRNPPALKYQCHMTGACCPHSLSSFNPFILTKWDIMSQMFVICPEQFVTCGMRNKTPELVYDVFALSVYLKSALTANILMTYFKPCVYNTANCFYTLGCVCFGVMHKIIDSRYFHKWTCIHHFML